MHGLIRKVIARLRLWTKNSRIIYSVALVLATTGVIGAVNDEPGIRDIAILSLLVLGVVAIFQTQQRISQRLYAEGRLTRTQIRRGGGVSKARSRPTRPAGNSASLKKPEKKSRKRTREVSSFRYGSTRWYANNGSLVPQKHLAKYLVLHRNLQGRDILARQVSSGYLDYNDLQALLEDFRSQEKHEVSIALAKNFYRRPLLVLARVVYLQDATPIDQIDALSMFELVASVFGEEALSALDFEYMISASLREKRHSLAAIYLSKIEDQSPTNFYWWQANVLNPFTSAQSHQKAKWLESFNEAYRGTGVVGISLSDGEGDPFSRLAANVSPQSVNGPLISVIMPMYKADHRADTSIRSILEQTWKNVELIIVDDGSPSKYQARLDFWEQSDSRVKVIRCAENRGAYTVRNIGLKHASGKWVTTQDSDDWSHPQRLEIQARYLQSKPNQIATWVQWLRVDQDLEVLHRRGPNNLQHNAMVSIMFSREPVRREIGFWDEVRKGADSEFRRRMEIAFKQKIELASDVPLIMGLHQPESLSGNDIHRGYFDIDRLIYRKHWRQWHREIESGETSAYMPIRAQERKFPTPTSLLATTQGAQDFDIIFASEFAFPGGNSFSLINEIQICINEGMRVGILRLPNLLFLGSAQREMHDGIEDMIRLGKIEEITRKTVATTPLLLVRWPAALQYVPEGKIGIDAQKVVIVANHPPYEGENGRHTYETGRVVRNAKQLFGIDPVWVPQSATIRRMLERQLPQSTILDVDWTGVLSDVPERQDPRSDYVGEKPVIGRHSRDNALKWPENRENLLEAYPIDGSVDVRILGGIDSVIASELVDAEELRDWTLFPFGSVPPADFLQTIDFFVYYTHREWTEAFGRVIMEAMFAGAVVILPPEYEPVFGDAAVYTSPDGVQQMVHNLYSDWESFSAQSERGRDYAYAHCTPAAYLNRLDKVTGVETVPAAAPVEMAVAQSALTSQ